MTRMLIPSAFYGLVLGLLAIWFNIGWIATLMIAIAFFLGIGIGGVLEEESRDGP